MEILDDFVLANPPQACRFCLPAIQKNFRTFSPEHPKKCSEFVPRPSKKTFGFFLPDHPKNFRNFSGGHRKKLSDFSRDHPKKLAHFFWWASGKTCAFFVFRGPRNFCTEFLKPIKNKGRHFPADFFVGQKIDVLHNKTIISRLPKNPPENSDSKNGCPRILSEFFFEMGPKMAWYRNMSIARPDKP